MMFEADPSQQRFIAAALLAMVQRGMTMRARPEFMHYLASCLVGSFVFFFLSPVPLHADPFRCDCRPDRSVKLARSIALSFDDLNVQSSDNYFDLLPGEPITINLKVFFHNRSA